MEPAEFDFKGFKMSGFMMLFLNICLIFVSVAMFIYYDELGTLGIILGVIGIISCFFILAGYMCYVYSFH